MSTGTAFYRRQTDLNRKAAWGEWAGYLAPLAYADSHDIEYNAVRQAAAVIDVSPLYKYLVSGTDAERLLDRVVTRDVSKLAVDQVLYTPWCDEDGKMVDDGTATRLSDRSFRVTSADPCYRWFLLNSTGLDAVVEDLTDSLAALALQGPLSSAVLAAAFGEDWSSLRYYRHRRSRVVQVEVSVTRTGYTGDLGYELWVPVDHALAVWDRLLEVGEGYGLRPAGLRALDVARVEAGLVLSGVEYTSARYAVSPEQRFSPFELGLGRLVSFEKASDFVGRRALLEERRAGGPPRRLVGLELEWAEIEGMFARHGLAPAITALVHREPVPVYRLGRQVGRVTSLTWGPTIKRMVGLGSIEAASAQPGTTLLVEWSVEGERGRVPATVVGLPFLNLPRKRA